MRDLIEMTYKCRLTPVTDCYKCKYYEECLLIEKTLIVVINGG